jgi:hypothetical protein
MQPEYVAYQHSSHARVACVDCHVGEGADWYVRSKLSGMYQVYAVTANVFPRPIPTPIENLRPARETCEQCHWPQKFYAQKLRLERHYLNDEENTQWDIKLRMRIGADHSALGLSEGIHWHINPDVLVEYVATDETNLELPWVRYKNLKTGDSIVYQDEDNLLEEGQLDTMQVRVMDCMDCHNRPSHLYRPPAFFVNEAITAGTISSALPGIKNLTVEICAEEFATMDSAMNYMRSHITGYYQEEYPEISEEQPELIEQAIVGMQDIFSKNIFPEMNVRWSAYPNHIGHLEFDGCFRCHNDRHSSEDGQLIEKDCNLCHVIEAQGTPPDIEYAQMDAVLDFKHPVDIDNEWREGLCTDCHTGLNP